MMVTMNACYWGLWMIIFVLLVISLCKEERLNLTYYTVTVLLVRNVLSLLDLEGKRFDKNLDKEMFVILLLWTVTILGVCINFLLTNMIAVVFISSISSLLSVIGVFVMTKTLDGSATEILS